MLEVLPIDVYREHQYSDQLPAARRLLEARDEDDVALAALALTLQIPIWSNDRDYDNFPTGVFTTAVMLKMLGE